VPIERLKAIRARRLFGGEFDIDSWIAAIARGEVRIRDCHFAGDEAAAADPAWRSPVHLPLVVRRGDRVAPVDDQTQFRNGDIVTFALVGETSPPQDFEPEVARDPVVAAVPAAGVPGR
jgi:hypothetical protein